MTCLHKLIVAQAIFQGKFLSNLMLNSLETTPTDRHRLSKRKKSLQEIGRILGHQGNLWEN